VRTEETVVRKKKEQTPPPDGANGHSKEEPTVQKVEVNASDLDITIDTMRGDIVDLFMDTVVRKMRLGWTDLAAFDQTVVVENVSRVAAAIIRRCLGDIADAGLPFVEGQTSKIAIDKALELKFVLAPTVENITALAEHGRNSAAVLVLADSKAYMGAREKQYVQPDEPELPIGDAPIEAAPPQEPLMLEHHAA
jgi:hypothetical protein